MRSAGAAGSGPRATIPYDASAFAFIASNSACVIAPESSSFLAFSISSAGLPARDRLDVRRLLRLRRLHRLHVALRHPGVVRDQVDEHAEERQDDDEDDPERLREAARVVPAEDVPEDRDQEPEPDHEREERDHPPQHIQERVISYEHSAPFGSLFFGLTWESTTIWPAARPRAGATGVRGQVAPRARARALMPENQRTKAFVRGRRVTPWASTERATVTRTTVTRSGSSRAAPTPRSRGRRRRSTQGPAARTSPRSATVARFAPRADEGDRHRHHADAGEAEYGVEHDLPVEAVECPAERDRRRRR